MWGPNLPLAFMSANIEDLKMVPNVEKGTLEPITVSMV